jgi:hypothetical protein
MLYYEGLHIKIYYTKMFLQVHVHDKSIFYANDIFYFTLRTEIFNKELFWR